MTSSTARPGPRHRAPSRWCHLESEGEVVTVAQLLNRNQRLLFNYRLARYRREHVGQPRRVAVVPRPRTTAD